MRAAWHWRSQGRASPIRYRLTREEYSFTRLREASVQDSYRASQDDMPRYRSLSRITPYQLIFHLYGRNQYRVMWAWASLYYQDSHFRHLVSYIYRSMLGVLDRLYTSSGNRYVLFSWDHRDRALESILRVRSGHHRYPYHPHLIVYFHFHLHLRAYYYQGELYHYFHYSQYIEAYIVHTSEDFHCSLCQEIIS